MWEILRHLYAFFVAVPIIGYLVVYGIVFAVTKNKAVSHLRAMDVTSIFLISAVSILWYNVTGGKGWLAVLTLYVLLGGFLVFLQQWVHGRFVLRKWMRAVWRLGFFLLAVSYCILFVTGIFTR